MSKKIITVVMLILVLLVGCRGIAYTADTDAKDAETSKLLKEGDSLIRAGKYAQALEKYKSALDSNPEDPACNYKVGVANYFLKDYDEAIKHYKAAIRLKPDYYKALNNLALIYEKKDENVEATLLYRKAIDANPDYPKARYNLGVVLYKRDRMKKAEETARELVNKFPKYGKGFYLLGLILESREKYGEAEDYYLKALSINSRHLDASEGIKRIRARLQMTAAQKNELKKARKIIPFRLPPGYVFDKIMETERGVRIISIKYKKEQDIYLVKFPDQHYLAEQNLRTLTAKPNTEFDKVLMEMKITGLSLKEIKRFKSEGVSRKEKEAEKAVGDKTGNNPDKGDTEVIIEDADKKPVDKTADNTTDTKNEEVNNEADNPNFSPHANDYAWIDCRINEKNFSGILALPILDESEGPMIYLAISPKGKFDLSVAKKFLQNLGKNGDGKDEKTI